ncbi:uncharacterized protein LOC6561239 [Drosophila grimshawi]|uniref:GH21737 n=1 Tax=Drosophila grimshawi TaxID=7222 RepID=B4J6H4_DROGR|nr:uncharacterized protein LOC6561239 [Drosophila grimshawi]EDW01975.1 GH21737 [Drosophila grimshawi]
MLHSRAFQRQSRKSYIGLLLLAFSAYLAQSVLPATAAEISYPESELHKDNEFPNLVKRPAFFVGSRYGRSSGKVASGSGGAPVGGVGTSKTRRLIIVPRNDRFFLGSRYGKRSEEFLSPYEQDSLGLALGKSSSLREAENEGGNEGKASSRGRTTPVMTMSCTYAGFSNFFRCTNVNTDEEVPLDSNSIASEDANINNNSN